MRLGSGSEARGAIEELPLDAASSSAADSLVREARAAARLNHPNVVTVHHVIRNECTIYIVMELLAQGSLADHLANHGAMRWHQATRAIRGATRGIAAAYAVALVHRDLKPCNLLCTADGTIKVGDFGLAAAFDEVRDGSVNRRIVGTPAYRAPEVWVGHGASPLADIYALGCTLFTLLTARLPFDVQSYGEMMYHHVHHPLPDVRQWVTAVPDALCELIARASAKEPKERYLSAAEMGETLDSMLSTPAPSHTFNGPVRATLQEADQAAQANSPSRHNLPRPLMSFIGRSDYSA